MSEALWQSVLLRAIEDAFSTPVNGESRARRAQDMIEARAYLTKPSKDLAAVCAMAGVDMAALIDRMTQRIATAADLITVTKDKPDLARKHCRNVFYEHDGKQLTVKQLSELSGVSKHLIYSRLQKGWPIEAALDPVKMQGRRHSKKISRMKLES